MKTIFDEINRKILNILVKDGREPLTKISEEISLSNTGIKKRIAKLNASGIFKVQGNFNLDAMEFKTCLILLEVKNFELLTNIIKAYKNCPYVFLIAETLGSFNLLMGFYGNRDNDLNFKLKYCGPSNKEGVLHSKIILISDLKSPKFLPLQIFLNNSNDDIYKRECGYNCNSCEAFLNKQCKRCF